MDNENLKKLKENNEKFKQKIIYNNLTNKNLLTLKLNKKGKY
jgi:hypothetical protein